ncbi:MAG: sigma-70 family RNA polymerase sigma factor [Patescibacteria group bacterium]
MDETKKRELKALVEKVGTGDQEAFRVLYESLIGRLFNYVRQRTSSEEDTNDLLQDIFLDLWNAFQHFEYRTEGHFYAFIFIVTKRRLARHYKTKRSHDSLDDLLPSQHPRVDAELNDPDGMKPLVARLSPKYRDVMTLRYWSGLGFAEIADMLGTNENTVKVRHHRALKQLRNLMAEHT